MATDKAKQIDNDIAYLEQRLKRVEAELSVLKRKRRTMQPDVGRERDNRPYDLSYGKKGFAR
jgi:hypothetical protein